eukprot:jgi/Picre1/33830/NNA_001309.t1
MAQSAKNDDVLSQEATQKGVPTSSVWEWIFALDQLLMNELKKAVESVLAQEGAVRPEKALFFRSQMQTIISRALTDAGIQPVPKKASTLFTLNMGAPEELPDALRGESWSFVQLPLGALKGEFNEVLEGNAFGNTLDIASLGLDVDDDTLIPGVAVYSRRANPLAAWTNGLELAAVVADTERAFLVLETGVNERWKYGAYNRTQEATEEARAWEQVKQDVQEAFTKNRHAQKHSSDELLRYQNKDKRRVGPIDVDTSGLQDSGHVPDTAVVADSLRNAISFYETLQDDDGHWPGDYGGPMFLMPGLIITCYVTGTMSTALSKEHQAEMRRYLFNHQNQDGGYGLHIEGNSTMFGTVLSYVALRILGVPMDDDVCVAARAWMHARGGAHSITSWGKFWLAVLGVYEWKGLNPMPPEMWLLPYSSWTGIGWLHPGRFWCHCRMVYLPMSYIYGIRGTCKPTDLTKSLKEELYPCPYDSIDWDAARNLVAKEDLYYPHPWIQDVLWWTLSKAEPLLLGSWLRKKALKETMVHIHYEDENTRYVDIGPVTSPGDCIHWVECEFKDCLKKAGNYIESTQVIEEAQPPLSKYYRHISKGAWPFSTRDHGWPISDCTSEGLKAAMALKELEHVVNWDPLPLHRLNDLLELINPSETFGDIVIDYCYVECTSACITAMTAFAKNYSGHRSIEIQNAIDRGISFIKSIQKPDGSWYGSWGVCFTYGTWFGLEALAAVGETAHQKGGAARRACDFLISKQEANGGWGESYLSCQDKVYSPLPNGESHVVNTGWALLGLIAAKYHEIDRKPLDRAAAFLIQMQQKNGDWPQQHISGVFNRNCSITYANYRNIFPIWALGEYKKHVL